MSLVERLYRRPGWRFELASAIGAGIFLGLVGPFGSYGGGSLPERLTYWVGMVLIGTAVFGTAARLLLSTGGSALETLKRLLTATVLLAIPFAAFTRTVARWLWPGTARISVVEWYLQVLTLAVPLVLLTSFALLRRRSGQPARARNTASPSLLGVDPAEVLCLQMEDHYVRVHTASGSTLVLATMAQARAPLRSVRGLQVHRSWWVAEHAVACAEQDGRNLRLRLRNGVTAPVARSAVPQVRAAGWLATTAQGDAELAAETR
jgi:hypothetical protein